MNPRLPDFDDVLAAAARIAPHANRTPVLRSRSLDALAGAELHFKCEHLQRVGAFKFRGACNAVQALDADVAARGVVTHSSGNHGAALALAARERGIPAHVVVPDGANAVKIERPLLPLFPQERWTMLSHLLIEHDRQVCDAKKPRCGECVLAELCPSART